MFETFRDRKILIRAWVPLLVILICGITLRLVFLTGITRNDEVNYAHAAFELARGTLNFDYWWQGTTRLALYLPVAILYAIFGPSIWTTLAFPLASSILCILTVYLVGNFLESEKTGLIASLLWALFPLDVFQAGMLRPDGPLAAFNTLSVLFLLLALSNKTLKRYLFFMICLFFLIWSLAIKPLALITVFFYIFLGLIALWRSKKEIQKRFRVLQNTRVLQVAVIPTSVVIAAGAAFLLRLQRSDVIVLVADTATNAGRLLLIGESNMNLARGINTSTFLLTAPLLLIAIITLTLEKNKSAQFLLSWFGFGFLYYEWGTISLSASYFPILNFVEARSILFILSPAILLIGLYLSRNLDEKTIKTSVLTGACLTILVCILYQEELRENAILPPWFYALIIMSLVFVLLSPLVLSKENSHTRETFILFFIALCVSFLLPSSPYHVSYWEPQRAYQADLREMAAFLNQQQGPVFVPNLGTATDLNFASDFKLGFAWSGETGDFDSYRVQIAPAPSAGEVAYVVRLSLMQEAEGWDLIREYENPYKDLYLYKVQPMAGQAE